MQDGLALSCEEVEKLLIFVLAAFGALDEKGTTAEKSRAEADVLAVRGSAMMTKRVLPSFPPPPRNGLWTSREERDRHRETKGNNRIFVLTNP